MPETMQSGLMLYGLEPVTHVLMVNVYITTSMFYGLCFCEVELLISSICRSWLGFHKVRSQGCEIFVLGRMETYRF